MNEKSLDFAIWLRNMANESEDKLYEDKLLDFDH